MPRKGPLPPIEFTTAHRYLFIGTDSFLTKEIVQQYDVGVGDEVFMVGRLISHDGKQQNSPSVRWGHISMIPNEPVYHPSNRTMQQESILIEVHSIHGYSGSPVFVRPFPTQKLEVWNTSNTTVAAYADILWRDIRIGGPWLHGVEWGYMNTHDQTKNNTGISGVVPAWFVLDLLNTAKLQAQRAEEQRKLVERVRQGGSTLT